MSKTITYVNDGQKTHGKRTVDAYTAENIWGFNNPTQKDAAPAPFLNAGGGLIDIPAEGLHFTGTTPKKVILNRGTYYSDASHPLVVTVNGKATEVGVGQDLLALMPGAFDLKIAFKDGKPGQANLISRH